MSYNSTWGGGGGIGGARCTVSSGSSGVVVAEGTVPSIEEVLRLLEVVAQRQHDSMDAALRQEIQQLLLRFEPPGLEDGLYRLFWKSGVSSLASVGSLHDGRHWFAAVNWTSDSPRGIASCGWYAVERAQKLSP